MVRQTLGAFNKITTDLKILNPMGLDDSSLRDSISSLNKEKKIEIDLSCCQILSITNTKLIDLFITKL